VVVEFMGLEVAREGEGFDGPTKIDFGDLGQDGGEVSLEFEPARFFRVGQAHSVEMVGGRGGSDNGKMGGRRSRGQAEVISRGSAVF